MPPDRRPKMRPLSRGTYTFTSITKNLVFEYVVHTSHPVDDVPSNLLVIQCSAWGLGSGYLESSLARLHTHHRYTLLFFHPRGTDGSSRPTDPTHMCAMPFLASDLEDLRIHLEIDKFHALIGHSHGGAITLGYAEMFPTRVEKLILISHQLLGYRDYTAALALKDDPRYNETMRMPKPDPPPKTDEECTFHMLARMAVYFYDPYRMVPQIKGMLQGRLMPLWVSTSLGLSEKKYMTLNPRQMLDNLGRVRAKTLIIYGHFDLVTGLGSGRVTNERIIGAKMISYGQCGHFPMLEQEKNTLEDIIFFLAS